MLYGDRYAGYAELQAREREGIDYRVCVTDRSVARRDRRPRMAVGLKGWTSELAAAIAGDTFSLYCFEGCGPVSRELSYHVASI